jgi:hypothetical protein
MNETKYESSDSFRFKVIDLEDLKDTNLKKENTE